MQGTGCETAHGDPKDGPRVEDGAHGPGDKSDADEVGLIEFVTCRHTVSVCVMISATSGYHSLHCLRNGQDGHCIGDGDGWNCLA